MLRKECVLLLYRGGMFIVTDLHTVKALQLRLSKRIGEGRDIHCNRPSCSKVMTICRVERGER